MRSRRREQTLNLYAGFNKSFGQKLMLDFSLAGEATRRPCGMSGMSIRAECDLPAQAGAHPATVLQQRQELSVLLGSAGRRVLPGRGILRDTGQPAAEARERLPTFAELHLEVEVRFLFWFNHNTDFCRADPLPVARTLAGDIPLRQF